MAKCCNSKNRLFYFVFCAVFFCPLLVLGEKKVDFDDNLRSILQQNDISKYDDLLFLIRTAPDSFDNQAILDLIETDFENSLPKDKSSVLELTKLLLDKNSPSLNCGSLHYILAVHYSLEKDLDSAILEATKAKLFFYYSNNLQGRVKSTFLIKLLLEEKSNFLKFRLINSFLIFLGFLLLLFFGFILSKRKKYFKLKEETLVRQFKIDLIKEHVKGQEEEKSKIAIELHDGVANELVGLLFLTENEVKNKISLIINKVRSLSHELSITDPHEFNDIEDLTRSLVSKYFSDGLSVSFVGLPKEKKLRFKEDKNEHNLYRIIQELFVNILKHSNANSVVVEFKLTTSSLRLSIKDNGVGMNSKFVKEGIGLKNIKKRIKQMQFKISIESITNQGTSITLFIPINAIEQV